MLWMQFSLPKQNAMKTSFYQRMFIVVATVSAIACTEPDIFDNGRQIQPGPQGNSAKQTGVYRTSVTTWMYKENNYYIGLVAHVPTNFWEGKVTVVEDGNRISVDTYFDADNMPTFPTTYGNYYWATRQNNLMMLHYVGPRTSPPPFNLEVVITF